MVRRIFAIAAATALLPALLAASAPAVSAAPASSPIVVHGRVLHHGRPVKGAKVVLFAEPSPSVLKKVKRQHNVPTKIIGQGETNSKGYYAVAVSDMKAARAYSFGRPPVVNLEIMAVVSKVGAARWFSRTVALTGLAAMSTSDTAAPPMTPDVENLTIPDAVPPPPADLRSALLAPKGGYPTFCMIHVFDRNLGVRNAVVGATYSNMAKVKMAFEYGVGQSSSLGMGVAIAPPPGFKGWDRLGYDMSAGGTTSVSSDITEPFPDHQGIRNDAYSTGIVYAEYFQNCVGGYVQAVSFAGGTTDNQVTGFASDNHWCRHYAATSRPVRKNTDQAYTFSGGVSMSFWIGFNLSATTGYDHTAELDYTFPHGGYLCGTDGWAAGTASGNLLYAGLYHHSPSGRK